jgi:exodeoxyribonuclease V alpha subunit
MENVYKFKIIPQHERYYNQDANWGVYTFITSDDIPEYDIFKDPFGAEVVEVKMSSLVGKMQQLYLGSEYYIVAKLEFNKKYNAWNYTPTSVSAIIPKTIENQKNFLEALITKKQVDSLINAYPNIVEDVINGQTEIDYSKTKWIKEYTWNNIKDKIINNYVISDILLLLQPLGVTYTMIKKLISNHSNATLLKQELLNNPYMLTEIHGLGFTKVDGLALKLKPELRESSKRTYAFMKYYLQLIGANNGHTWITLDELESAIRDNICECENIYHDIIDAEKQTKFFLYIEDDKVGLMQYRMVEVGIFEILKDLNCYNTQWNINVEAGIQEAEIEQGFLLTDEQKQVVANATKNNVVLISGKAGVGKSVSLRAILRIYKNYSVCCVALSAKAAQRIKEATGHPSSTIHRLLGAKGFHEFEYNEMNPLPFDVVVLDESSMVNAPIYYCLLKAIKPGAKIIMCGDNKQLPPIGYGNIFSDLLNMSSIFNVNQLTKVMRQAELSGILSDANKIREGINPVEQPELKLIHGELQDMYYMFRENREALNDIAIKTFLKTIEDSNVGIDETIIVVPRKQDCINSTHEINIQIQDALLDKSVPFILKNNIKFKLGAKVMQIENNYDKNIFNGDIGYVDKIWQDDKNNTEHFQIKFQDRTVEYSKNELSQIDFAYALTCHKCQGSGYHTVIAIIDTTHYTLLDTHMLYTMITRAKKRCLLLADPKAFKRCLDNNCSTIRKTWLPNLV